MSTTVTTVTTIVNVTMVYGLGILAAAVLIGLLITKHLSGTAARSYGSSRELSVGASLERVLSIAIIPLLIAFATLVWDKIDKVIR